MKFPKDFKIEISSEFVNKEDRFACLIGMEVNTLKKGYAEASILITEDLLNIYDMAHGGVIFSLADHVCESAGNSLGRVAVAIQNNIEFLAPAKKGDLLTAKGKVTHTAGKIGLVEVEIKNQKGELIAKNQQIIYFKGKK